MKILFVNSNYRGQKFGKRMLAYIAQIAINEGCERLEWSVLNWNESAISFYSKIGAQFMEGWTTCRLSKEPLEKLGFL